MRLSELEKNAILQALEYTKGDRVMAAVSSADGVPVPQGLTSWMTFVAVMKMIHGVIMCLTCIGAIAGVPKIISSVNFLNAKNMLAAMPSVDPAMLPFLEKLRVGFKALGWSIIGLFIFVVLVIILEVVFFAAFMPNLSRMH